MSEWQPIATAPKDGTPVDLWYPEIGRAADYHWNTDKILVPSGAWVHHDRTSDDVCMFINREPTHWMPLPTPPEGSQ